jgi:hypothetical protein
MFRRTLKVILMIGAVALVPASSHANREWFWDNGLFGADEVSPDLKPTRRMRGQVVRGQVDSSATNQENRSLAKQKRRPQKEPTALRQQASAFYNGSADLERRAIQRDRADLRRQQAALEKRGAQLAKLEATLKQKQAKLRQQPPERALALQQTSITCDAAAAVVADFGFQEVKPELCKGNTLRFGAIRDGTKFLIELAANGELTKVRRLPEKAN